MTNYRASITNDIFFVTAAFGTFHGCEKQDLKGPHRYRKSQNYHTRPIHPITGRRFLIHDLLNRRIMVAVVESQNNKKCNQAHFLPRRTWSLRQTPPRPARGPWARQARGSWQAPHPRSAFRSWRTCTTRVSPLGRASPSNRGPSARAPARRTRCGRRRIGRRERSR